jgi:DME family drug/metabolite transporter
LSRFTLSAGLIQITVTALLWGTTGVAVAVISDLTSLGPNSIAFFRLAIGACALLVLAAATRRIAQLLRTVRAAPVRVLLAGIGLGGYQALYFFAVAAAGVGVATVVSLGLAPIVTTVWESARARRRPGRAETATLAAGVGGLLLITLSTGGPAALGTRALLGLLAAVASGLAYGATTLVSRELARHGDAMTLTGTTSVVGALALLPLAARDGLAVPLDAEPIALLGYIGVVATAVAYTLFYAGLRTVPASAAAVLTLLEPLTAALLAVVVLAEPLPALTVAGGLLMLTAVAGLYLRSQPA